MIRTEAEAYNRGVADVLAIASLSAGALARDPRHIPVGFAIAALDELSQAGKALLIELDPPHVAAALPSPAPTPTPQSTATEQRKAEHA